MAVVEFNTKNLLSRGRKGDCCRTGFEGLGDSLDKGIPTFAAEARGVPSKLLREGFLVCIAACSVRSSCNLVLSYITCVIYRALSLPHESMYCSAS